MRGASGVFLVASWRTGFSLFLWLGLILVVFFLFQCIKSLLLGLKEQGMSLLHLGDSRRTIDQVQPCRRHRRRDPDIYTVNCPPVLQSATLRNHDHDVLHLNENETRPTSSPPNLSSEYVLPNTPTPSGDNHPPSYSSLYTEEPPAYETIFSAKDNQQNRIPPV